MSRLLSRAFSTLNPFPGQAQTAESWKGLFPRDPSMICPLCRHFGKKMKWIPKHSASHQPSIHLLAVSVINQINVIIVCAHRCQITATMIRSGGCFLEKQYLSIFGRGEKVHLPIQNPKETNFPMRFWHCVSWTKSFKVIYSGKWMHYFF